MKAFSDFIAVLLFFIVYMVTKDIYLSTIAAMVTATLQLIFCFMKYKKIGQMQIISFLLIIAFGGATIFLKNPHFIMWKPTALFWIMSIALLISLLLGKNILKGLMGKEVSLPESIWHNLTWAWIIFLGIMGLINITIAYYATEEQWVNYKLFGSTGLLIIFVVVQSIYMGRFISNQKEL